MLKDVMRPSARAGTEGRSDEPLKPPSYLAAPAVRTFLVGVLVVALAMTAYRIYQQLFAWTKGLDSASPDFNYYWMSVLAGEVVALAALAALWWPRYRRVKTDPARLTPDEEAARIMKLWAFLAVLCLVLFFEASYTAEQDGSWHMSVIRDTHFTPSHIVIFYFTFPLGVITAVGSYMYARAYLPHLFKNQGFPLSYGLLIMATVLEVAQVAFNEFGHTLWISEETFAVPFHWGFVLFVWLGGGIFAIWFQTALRLLELGRAKAAGTQAGEHVA